MEQKKPCNYLKYNKMSKNDLLLDFSSEKDTQQQFLSQNELIEHREECVFYDTIRLECKATDKILFVLQKYFSYGRIQAFRMEKDETYKIARTIDLAEVKAVYDNVMIDKTEDLGAHIFDGRIDDAMLLQSIANEETGELEYEKKPDFWESRGVNTFYKYNPSGNYDMNVCLSFQRSEITKMNQLLPIVTFEFSIPKFVFGHNLLLFPLRGDVDGKELDFFIRDFFKVMFDENYVFLNVVIKRLDCCYNYKFKDKENFELWRKAETFFFQTLNTKNYKNENNETFYYKTDAFSCKLYDKKAEFEKHDKQKLYKHYLKKMKPFITMRKAQEYAQAKVEQLLQFSENIWRLELCLRNAELNNNFWRDWRKRSFPLKSMMMQKYPYYRFMQNSLKVYTSFMKKPMPIENEDEQTNISNYKKWLDGLVINGNGRFEMPVSNQRLAMSYFCAREDYMYKDYLEMMRKFMIERVVEYHRWVDRYMSVRPCVPAGCNNAFIAFNSSRGVYTWDSLMVQRALLQQRNFLAILKICQRQKKVNLSHYLQINTGSLVGLVVKIENNNGKFKEVVLTKSLISALVKYVSAKKSKLDVPRTTAFRNNKILEAIKKEFNIADVNDFYCDEIFSLDFCFNEKYLYICPVVDSKLSRSFIPYQLHGHINWL